MRQDYTLLQHRLDQDPGRLRLGSELLVYNPHAHGTKSIRSGDMLIENQSSALKGVVRSSILMMRFCISVSDFCFRVGKWELRRLVRRGNEDFLQHLVQQFIFLNGGFTLLVLM